MNSVRVCHRQTTVPANEGFVIRTRLLQLRLLQYAPIIFEIMKIAQKVRVVIVACSQSLRLLDTNDLRRCMYLTDRLPCPVVQAVVLTVVQERGLFGQKIKRAVPVIARCGSRKRLNRAKPRSLPIVYRLSSSGLVVEEAHGPDHRPQI